LRVEKIVLLRAAGPDVLGPLEPDVSPSAVEALGDRVLPGGILRAVDAPAGEESSELRDPDAEDLLREDVVNALVEIRYLRREAVGEPPRDLTQEDPRLRKGLDEGHGRISPDRRSLVALGPGHLEHVEHLVRELG